MLNMVIRQNIIDVKKWNFHDADRYDDVYEIILTKKSIRQNMPQHIGCSVFDDSKLRMYEFYYDCVDKYNDRR